MIAVLDPPDFAIAFARADVAAYRALVADTRRELQVPLAGVMIGMALVGEDTGGTDFGQVTGKAAFQSAFLMATEIDVVLGPECAQVRPASIVVVEAHAAVARDAAVHLVGDERAQILVATGALAEPVAAPVVTGHHGHVLKVAVAAFLAHRAIVRMVDHQPFHHAGAESPGFLILDINAGAVSGRGHTRHHQHTPVVLAVLVLAYGTLAAGADTAHGRVPAEIGYVQAQGQAGLKQVICPVHLVALAVHVDGCHGAGLLPVGRQ